MVTMFFAADWQADFLQLTDWQTLAALLCVAAAAGALAVRIARWLRGTGQSGCHSCPARQAQPLVPLSSLTLSPTLRPKVGQAPGLSKHPPNRPT